LRGRNEGLCEVVENDPYDRSSNVSPIASQLFGSREYMNSIRNYQPPQDSFAIWFFGQNGFVIKDANGPLIGVDLYLSNSCADTFSHLPFRLDRQLPIFVEPEDLDLDVFVTTHSHDDHADPQTITRIIDKSRMSFVGPFHSLEVYRRCGVPESSIRILHAGETITHGSTCITGTFAYPTDATDLNHIGLLVEFSNGLTFYNTGDTAWTQHLATMLPRNVDVCAVCINGGFHNLGPMEAAEIVKSIRPKVVIPCHYDMMVNNVGSPNMFRVALDLVQSSATFRLLKYYEPWVYMRTSQGNSTQGE